MNRQRHPLSVFRLLPLLLVLAACNTTMREYLKPGRWHHGTAADSLKGELGPMRSCYDVIHYDLTAQFDIENRYVRGEVVMTFVMTAPSDTIQIDLRADMLVNRISDEEKFLYFRRTDDRILIPAARFRPGIPHQITVNYEGKPLSSVKPPWVGGFVWKRDAQGQPHVGVVCEGVGPSFWWPCKDHPSDEPDSMDLHLTAPAGLTAVSNGRLIKSEEITAALTRWHWKVQNPISPAGITVQMGAFALAQDTMQYDHGLRTLDYYVLPSHFSTAKKHFAQVKNIIRVYESLFGPYPWWNDGYKLIETPYVGMEHQTAIAYGNGFSNENHHFTFGLADYILLHETAHEWWGNCLSACDPAEVWLHEGFATYSEGLFIERELGHRKLVEYLQMRRRQIKNRTPMVGPPNVNYFNWRDDDVYSKGACFLHTLRCAIADDEQFFHILRTYSSRFSRQVVCTDDFIGVVNEVTGEDYRPVFWHYLYETHPPVLEYYFDGKTLYHRWAEVGGSFRMPVVFRAGTSVMKVRPTVVTATTIVENAARVQPMESEFYIKTEWKPELAGEKKQAGGIHKPRSGRWRFGWR